MKTPINIEHPAFQINESVNLNLGTTGVITNCNIAAIKYTNSGKVFYDLTVLVRPAIDAGDHVSDTIEATLHGVDSFFVEKFFYPLAENDPNYGKG